ncbi:PUA-like domain-containing protein [Thamnocephalis sphaerospora]|uniref:PUA-like domain-containing protein n=1 Tax=Thamnocephalis sphaerospora TaxID=78915 RepID=A0A4P9XQX6_9FUNG|nr:PUA-like domain-containing protein [Thamnocephalis sphaerospora]|eukprot:RKP07911.1 PUA-like domain-containing protein [Thamnocephalis sphaerospora]
MEAPGVSATHSAGDATGSDLLARWSTRLHSELQCAICHNLVYRPTITPCGHTFCRSCLERGHDHSQVCPSCRQPLPSPVALFTYGRHHLLTALTRRWLSHEYHERILHVQTEEVHAHRIDYAQHPNGALLPIFVCTLVFPGMPCYLHIFEPRYRLLLRRCWVGSRRFGMICGRPSQPEPAPDQLPYREYGTVLIIEKMRFLPDGRMMVLSRGERRFRVVHAEPQLDGYNMATVAWIDDLDIIDLQQRQQQYTETLHHIMRQRLLHYRRFADQALCERIAKVYGPIPEGAQALSYWAASIVPLDRYIRYEALTLPSIRQRLLLTSSWLDTLDQHRNWWWLDSACSIM